MTTTDEALVADWNILDDGCECEVCVVARALASRLSALLSQPPSGGWDDAVVERLRKFTEAFHVSHAFTSSLRKAGYAPEGDWDDASREFTADMRAALNAAASSGAYIGERSAQNADYDAHVAEFHQSINAPAPRESLSVEPSPKPQLVGETEQFRKMVDELVKKPSAPAPRGEEGWVRNAAVTIADEIMRQASRATVRGRSGMHVSVNEHLFDCEKIARLLAAAPKAPLPGGEEEEHE